MTAANDEGTPYVGSTVLRWRFKPSRIHFNQFTSVEMTYSTDLSH